MDFARLRFNDEPLELYIRPCICEPRHQHHPPPFDKPLRICIEGPLVVIKKVLPDAKWHFDQDVTDFPQPGGVDLASLTYRTIYGREPQIEVVNDLVLRGEYVGMIVDPNHVRQFDYYGVTFDHLVPSDDKDPEVLQINIFETDHDGGEYANGATPVAIEDMDYRGKKVLALPRCCQHRKGTTDRLRVNDGVNSREKEEKRQRELKASRLIVQK